MRLAYMLAFIDKLALNSIAIMQIKEGRHLLESE